MIECFLLQVTMILDSSMLHLNRVTTTIHLIDNLLHYIVEQLLVKKTLVSYFRLHKLDVSQLMDPRTYQEIPAQVCSLRLFQVDSSPRCCTLILIRFCFSKGSPKSLYPIGLPQAYHSLGYVIFSAAQTEELFEKSKIVQSCQVEFLPLASCLKLLLFKIICETCRSLLVLCLCSP
jgi:hypothetical protein